MAELAPQSVSRRHPAAPMPQRAAATDVAHARATIHRFCGKACGQAGPAGV